MTTITERFTALVDEYVEALQEPAETSLGQTERLRNSTGKRRALLAEVQKLESELKGAYELLHRTEDEKRAQRERAEKAEGDLTKAQSGAAELFRLANKHLDRAEHAERELVAARAQALADRQFQSRACNAERTLLAERKAQEQFAIRVLGQEAYDNAPCQAHPLELVEAALMSGSLGSKPSCSR